MNTVNCCSFQMSVINKAVIISLAIDEPLEYARLYLDGNLQMWVDAEDSLELY